MSELGVLASTPAQRSRSGRLRAPLSTPPDGPLDVDSLISGGKSAANTASRRDSGATILNSNSAHDSPPSCARSRPSWAVHGAKHDRFESNEPPTAPESRRERPEWGRKPPAVPHRTLGAAVSRAGARGGPNPSLSRPSKPLRATSAPRARPASPPREASSTYHWEPVPCGGEPPCPRTHAAAAAVGTMIYVLGGSASLSAMRASRRGARPVPSRTASFAGREEERGVPVRAASLRAPGPLGGDPVKAAGSNWCDACGAWANAAGLCAACRGGRGAAAPLRAASARSLASSVRSTASSSAAVGPPLSDMYVLDVQARRWSRVAAKGAPPAVSHHTLTAVGDELWAIGGWTGRRRTADVHVFDTRSGEWRAAAVHGDVPCGLSSHTATPTHDGRIVVVGREGGVRMQRRWTSVFELDTATCAWRELHGSQVASRAGHSAVLAGGRLAVWGGRNGHVVDWVGVRDGHGADVGPCALAEAALPRAEGDGPMARSHHCAWTVGHGCMLVHGGQLQSIGVSIGANVDGSMWLMRAARGATWYEVPVTPGRDVRCTGHAGAVAGGAVYMLCGETYEGLTNDVMVLREGPPAARRPAKSSSMRAEAPRGHRW
ncbi:unnamed protein product [Pedinophyceae sp. YPF-701]|nr:unnamed protein product [Pedinophyceae sp. YPF-701]